MSAALIDKAFEIAEPHILALYAKLEQHVEAGNPCCPATGGDNLDILERLAGNVQRIGRRGTNDDGGAVLVVVEYWNIHSLTADFLDDEAIRRFDVFKVDRAEGRLERTDDIGQLLRVWLIQLDVEAVDIGEFLEEDGLALHHRLGRKRADIAKAQNSGAIGDNGDKIPTRGIVEGGIGVGLDFEAGLGHAGAVGAGKVAAVGERLGGPDLELSGFGKAMIVQRRLTQRVALIVRHGAPRLNLV